MRQELTTDQVSRFIEASPQALYDLISDVTRTPEYSNEVVRCTWIGDVTGPKVGARFKAINKAGRGPNWPNEPVVVAAEPGREFAFARTEKFAGTIVWRFTFVPEGSGTRVTESYEVTRKLTIVGWFIIGTLYGLKDRRTDLHDGMTDSLDTIAGIAAAATNPAHP
jgi:hypothetical protein